jgi:spermidine synthase
VLLGMVSPLAVRLKIADLGSSGRTVGRLCAISTLGSILGTFGAGFWLIAFFGSTNILLVLALTLAATSVLAEVGLLKAKIAAIGLFTLLLVGAMAYDAHLAGLGVHDIDTEYSRILVYDGRDWRTDRKMRVLVTNPGGFQSGMYLDGEHADTELALPYTRFYKLAPHFRPDVKRMLMLGGGGYSFPKHVMANWPGVRMDVVEIDPQVTDIARKYFALKDDLRLRIFHEDARNFLNRYHAQTRLDADAAFRQGKEGWPEGRYDVILTDTFNSHHSIPFHLSTVEAVGRLHGLLDENGVVLANILSAIDGDLGRFLRAEYATFKAVFPQVYLFPVSDPDDPKEWQNILLVALKSDKVPNFTSPDPELNEMLSHRWEEPVKNDLPILSDEYAPVDRYITLVE